MAIEIEGSSIVGDSPLRIGIVNLRFNIADYFDPDFETDAAQISADEIIAELTTPGLTFDGEFIVDGATNLWIYDSISVVRPNPSSTLYIGVARFREIAGTDPDSELTVSLISSRNPTTNREGEAKVKVVWSRDYQGAYRSLSLPQADAILPSGIAWYGPTFTLQNNATINSLGVGYYEYRAAALGSVPSRQLECAEAFDSREQKIASKQEATLIYHLWRTEDEILIRQKLEATAPPIYQGMIVEDYTLTPIGGGVWKAVVSYVLDVDENEESSTYTFDTTGGTTRMTLSLGTRRYGSLAPDCKGAIGVSGDKIEGVDVTIPAYAFSETHKIPAAFVNQTFKNNVFQLTGKVSNGAYKGFAPGEVLFLGATGQRSDSKYYSITYNFAASPNVQNLNVGGIVVALKRGWEYLWCLHADALDTAAQRIVKRPIGVYVEQVYPIANLELLGL
jgi:hypothetical protein